MRHLLVLLVCFAAPVLRAAGDQPPFAIPATKFEEPSARERVAIMAAICDGKVDENGQCDTCPGGSSVPTPGFSFGLRGVIPGHFLGPDSEDAFATISGCEQMHASVGWGFLLARRDGEWKNLEESLGIVLDNCHVMQFRSRRQLLICEDFRMSQFHLMHSVTALFAKGESLGFRNLLTATDTTQDCYQQDRVQKALIDKIEFRDLNGDGIEDISITAAFGTLPDSERRQRACDDAEHDKPGLRRPEPKALKTYRIDYLFDGLRFTLTKDSQVAAKLFNWEN